VAVPEVQEAQVDQAVLPDREEVTEETKIPLKFIVKLNLGK
jgi:hypothetical protein